MNTAFEGSKDAVNYLSSAGQSVQGRKHEERDGTRQTDMVNMGNKLALPGGMQGKGVQSKFSRQHYILYLHIYPFGSSAK